MAAIATGVTVTFGASNISATSVSVQPPSAEVVDVTGYSTPIGERSLVSTGDKVGGAVITVAGHAPTSSSWGSSVGSVATLTISGTNIPTYTGSAVLTNVTESYATGSLGNLTLTFTLES